MTNQHPITLPPELVQQWADAYFGGTVAQNNFHLDLANRAVQWGADCELNACCEWFASKGYTAGPASLRAARRPKPPSLKEQALETLKYPKDFWSEAEVDTIRRALEQIDD
jgi:hypothetical protein